MLKEEEECSCQEFKLCDVLGKVDGSYVVGAERPRLGLVAERRRKVLSCVIVERGRSVLKSSNCMMFWAKLVVGGW